MRFHKHSRKNKQSTWLFLYDFAFLVFFILSIIGFGSIGVELLFSDSPLASAVMFATNVFLVVAFVGNIYLHRKWKNALEDLSLLKKMGAYLGRLVGGLMAAISLFSIVFIIYTLIMYRSLIP